MPIDLSFDPLDTPATLEELKDARIAAMEGPLRVADGYVFQYAEADERTMRKALVALEADPASSVGWRQLDNTPVEVNALSLRGYLEELDLLQARRGVAIDSEYMEFREEGDYTRRQLTDWVKSYAP